MRTLLEGSGTQLQLQVEGLFQLPLETAVMVQVADATVLDEAALAPQALPAVTAILPFCPLVPDVTVTDVVPCPPVIDQPVGTVQVYVVAFGTAAILYTKPAVDGQTGVVPEIDPGVAGILAVVVKAAVLTVTLLKLPRLFVILVMLMTLAVPAFVKFEVVNVPVPGVPEVNTNVAVVEAIVFVPETL